MALLVKRLLGWKGHGYGQHNVVFGVQGGALWGLGPSSLKRICVCAEAGAPHNNNWAVYTADTKPVCQEPSCAGAALLQVTAQWERYWLASQREEAEQQQQQQQQQQQEEEQSNSCDSIDEGQGLASSILDDVAGGRLWNEWKSGYVMG